MVVILPVSCGPVENTRALQLRMLPRKMPYRHIPTSLTRWTKLPTLREVHTQYTLPAWRVK
jgi:hypothetical protein